MKQQLINVTRWLKVTQNNTKHRQRQRQRHQQQQRRQHEEIDCKRGGCGVCMYLLRTTTRPPIHSTSALHRRVCLRDATFRLKFIQNYIFFLLIFISECAILQHFYQLIDGNSKAIDPPGSVVAGLQSTQIIIASCIARPSVGLLLPWNFTTARCFYT